MDNASSEDVDCIYPPNNVNIGNRMSGSETPVYHLLDISETKCETGDVGKVGDQPPGCDLKTKCNPVEAPATNNQCSDFDIPDDWKTEHMGNDGQQFSANTSSEVETDFETDEPLLKKIRIKRSTSNESFEIVTQQTGEIFNSKDDVIKSRINKETVESEPDSTDNDAEEDSDFADNKSSGDVISGKEDDGPDTKFKTVCNSGVESTKYLNCKIIANDKCKQRSYTYKKFVWKTKPPEEDFPKFRRSPSAQPAGLNCHSDFQGHEKTKAISYWRLFFTDAIVQTIVKFTNIEARLNLTAKWVDTHQKEIEAFFGIWYLCGIQGLGDVPGEDLFSTQPGIGLLEAATVMSRNRFQLLMRFLRFDERSERDKNDPLAPIRRIFDPFVEQCRIVYSPSETVTVDESICDFKGQCKFVVYMPLKPNRYGIKIWCACDASNAFLCNAKIYCGKMKKDDANEMNLSENIVLELTKHLCNSGRTVTVDNYFASVSLADKLYEKKTYLLGTIRRGIPVDFVREELEEGETRFVFCSHRTLLKYQCRKRKAVYLLSTKHHQPELAQFGKGKPVVVLDYNVSKCGVDTLDFMISKYKCRRISRRWPMRMLGWILDAAALNSYRMYALRNNGAAKYSRRKYLGALGRELIKDAQDARLNEPTNHWYTAAMQRVLAAYRVIHGKHAKEDKRSRLTPQQQKAVALKEEPAHGSTSTTRRGRCSLCPRKSETKTAITCDSCKKRVCRNHVFVKYTGVCCYKE